MLLRPFHLNNNLPTHIKEDTYFPRQLPSVETNFEGCNYLWKYKTCLTQVDIR